MKVDIATLLEVGQEIILAGRQNWSKLSPTEVAIINHQIGQLKQAMEPIRVKRLDAERRNLGRTK